jgi:hypothetical protein
MSRHAEYDYFREVTTGGPAFRHGTLLLAYAYHALLRGVPVTSTCLYHSTQTMRCVNSSLESVKGQIADGTLAAIACLAAFEVIVSVIQVLFRPPYFNWLTLHRMRSIPQRIRLCILLEWRR